ncbi:MULTISPECIES: YSIRK-type signal peptide-containing protein [Enterobacterales]|nr:YSIRK-type signal peptide-containing protein [Klebsiella pneumoniae]MCB3011205.1 YSIRK-type signal peptide-containing protein [Klebsiella pneumoniae]MCB3212083.1 YSIRK-type signal peptide-containing protein [Klebsiella pneumoniae]MCB3223831.1 YSIRK-type signal peptide-containing protein [Klebsiella pneumoniae]MCB3226924.1 YSIRK-type signal peptide-containing protein [Klebsiella pneumoniae]
MKFSAGTASILIAFTFETKTK